MKIHLVDVSSDIVEDSFIEGEGRSTGCGLRNEKIGKSFECMADMLKYLATTYGLSALEKDYNKSPHTLETSRTVANHTAAQNGGWFEATPTELDAWRKGVLLLFSENFTVNYHYICP